MPVCMQTKRQHSHMCSFWSCLFISPQPHTPIMHPFCLFCFSVCFLVDVFSLVCCYCCCSCCCFIVVVFQAHQYGAFIQNNNASILYEMPFTHIHTSLPNQVTCYIKGSFIIIQKTHIQNKLHTHTHTHIKTHMHTCTHTHTHIHTHAHTSSTLAVACLWGHDLHHVGIQGSYQDGRDQLPVLGVQVGLRQTDSFSNFHSRIQTQQKTPNNLAALA